MNQLDQFLSWLSGKGKYPFFKDTPEISMPEMDIPPSEYTEISLMDALRDTRDQKRGIPLERMAEIAVEALRIDAYFFAESIRKKYGKCIRCGQLADTKYTFSEDVDEEGRPQAGPKEWCHDECLLQIRDTETSEALHEGSI